METKKTKQSKQSKQSHFLLGMHVALLDKVRKRATIERRSVSETIREALRQYLLTDITDITE